MKIVGEKNFSLFSNQLIKQVSKNHFTLLPTENGKLFIKLKQSAKRKVLSVTVNGRQMLDKSEEVAEGLLNLGEVDKGIAVDIQFTSPISEKFDSSSTKILVTNNLEKVIKIMDANKADLLYNVRQNTFVGSVNLTSTRKLFLSIPYDQNWQYKIDGNIVKAHQTLNKAFTEIDVMSGTHLIKISYQPKVLWYSIALSGLSMLILVVWELFNYVKKIFKV